MQKTKKKNGLAVKLGAALLAMCVLFGTFATSMTAHAWSFHGIDMSNVDSVDLYFLDITLPSQTMYVKNSDYGGGDSFPHPNWNKRQDSDVLLKFNFPNLIYTEKDTGKKQSVFLMQTFTLDCPKGSNTWIPFVVLEFNFKSKKLTFSLSNNYYKWLAAMSQNELNLCFKDLQIQMLFTGKQGSYITTMYDKPNKKYGFNGTIALRSEATDSGVFNPDDDNFELDAGNNGSNLEPPPPDNSGKDNFDFWEWLGDLFGQPASAVITVVIIIAAIVGLIFLIKFLKWAFK